MSKPRQTSDRVSKIAGRVMKRWERLRKQYATSWPLLKSEDASEVTWSEVLAMAASCLNQDQTKGKRK